MSSQHRGHLAVAELEAGLQDHRRFQARSPLRDFISLPADTSEPWDRERLRQLAVAAATFLSRWRWYILDGADLQRDKVRRESNMTRSLLAIASASIAQFDGGELRLEFQDTPLVARFHQLMNELGRGPPPPADDDGRNDADACRRALGGAALQGQCARPRRCRHACLRRRRSA
jgi:hypothetical protein